VKQCGFKNIVVFQGFPYSVDKLCGKCGKIVDNLWKKCGKNDNEMFDFQGVLRG